MTRLALLLVLGGQIPFPQIWLNWGQSSGASSQQPLPSSTKEVTPVQLAAAIDALGSFDYPTRTDAARTVRRAAEGLAAPALARAARSHAEGYVRYRALVLLAGAGEAAARETMRAVLADANDRLRAVAYGWFERHPDPDVLGSLVEAMARERSEFVRPALTRAIAAYGAEPRARDTLLPLVMRGEDYFRGAVIGALGDYRAVFALAAISDVAKLDGPLQDDAVIALGRIGDKSAVATLTEIQKTAPPERLPTIAAAMCLLDIDCDANETMIRKTLDAAASDGRQPMVRGAAHALASLAMAGRSGALGALLDRGVPAGDPVRAAVALAVGAVALRRPSVVLDVLEKRVDRDVAIELLRDAFDMLSEDFEEECFYVEMKRASLASPVGSARRVTAELLIRQLDF